MDYGTQPYDPYDELYTRPPERINYFAWTVAILLLTGFALAAWLGSFYIFNQPERPDSYRILQKLHKIEQPKRFELTAAPPGEFLNASELYDRYVGMGAAELAKTNAELLRNYIRNFQQVRGLVPYVVGGWPLFKSQERASIEQRLAEYRAKMAAAQGGPIAIPGASATPPPAKNELVRIEQARPVSPLAITPPLVASNDKLAKATPASKGKKGKKQKLESPPPAASPAQAVVAQNKPAPVGTPITVASALAPSSALNLAVATPAPASKPSDIGPGTMAQNSPVAAATPVPVLPAQPAPTTSNVALASNAGGS